MKQIKFNTHGPPYLNQKRQNLLSQNYIKSLLVRSIHHSIFVSNLQYLGHTLHLKLLFKHMGHCGSLSQCPWLRKQHRTRQIIMSVLKQKQLTLGPKLYLSICHSNALQTTDTWISIIWKKTSILFGKVGLHSVSYSHFDKKASGASLGCGCIDKFSHLEIWKIHFE